MGERYAFGVDEPWKAWVAYAKAGWDTITRHISAPHCTWTLFLMFRGASLPLHVQASSATMGLRHVLCSGCGSNIWVVLHLSRRFFGWCAGEMLRSIDLQSFEHFLIGGSHGFGQTQHSGHLLCAQVLNCLTASSSTFLQLKREAELS